MKFWMRPALLHLYRQYSHENEISSHEDGFEQEFPYLLLSHYIYTVVIQFPSCVSIHFILFLFLGGCFTEVPDC